MKLTKDNLLVSKHRIITIAKCIDTDDFLEDLKRFKYIKRLLNRYRDSGVLSERLILNHLIIIFNVFDIEAGLNILELKLEVEYWQLSRPFLIFLKAIKNGQYTNIDMDKNVVEKLREI